MTLPMDDFKVTAMSWPKPTHTAHICPHCGKPNILPNRYDGPDPANIKCKQCGKEWLTHEEHD